MDYGPFFQCFYHKACADGITAASVMHRDVKSSSSIHEARFTPIGHSKPYIVSKFVCKVGKKIPTWTKRYWAAFVDYTPPFSVVRDLASVVLIQGISPEKLIILDHHQEIPEDQIKRYELDSGWMDVKIIVNQEMSGASLAWRYIPSILHGGEERDHEDPSTPPLVRYVEDRDLWRFRYGDLSRIIWYGISYEIKLAKGKPNIESWSWSIDNVTRYLITGTPIYDAFITKTVKANNTSLWSIFDKRLFKLVDYEDEIRVLLIKNERSGDPFIDPGILSSVSLIDEVCSMFLDLSPEDKEKIGRYSVVAMSNNKRKVSFRSRNGDALKIATRFGGSGHRNAEGCTNTTYYDMIKESKECREIFNEQ
ncbi:hypothetical protein D6779_02885 [Candidatus Parcubacteria bacterium]|nr:MAG: hypothetical protein D6779_02885 [Candidatus Parcubacteria bacterium]